MLPHVLKLGTLYSAETWHCVVTVTGPWDSCGASNTYSQVTWQHAELCVLAYRCAASAVLCALCQTDVTVS